MYRYIKKPANICYNKTKLHFEIKMNNLFTELTLILVGAGLITYFMRFLKQPSIVAYILTGLIIGPLGLLHLEHTEIMKGLSEIGITLLLFMVGLDLDLSQLKRIGKAAILAGIGQVIFTSVLGFILIKQLSFDTIPAMYIAIALTFSSTIIVVKLLSEKRDLQSLYGKLAIGIFLIQDVIAIFLLIFLSTINGNADSPFNNFGFGGQIILTIAKAFLAGTVVVWLSKYVFPKLIQSIQKSDEMILLFALMWSLGLAAIFSLPIIGFNAAIGGFVAGLALANSGVHHQMSGRIKPIRDFFIIIFFIVLGSGLVFTSLSTALIPALILSAFVLIGNPLIVMIILGLMGYKPRVSFMTGVTVAQISEFSLILVALGFASGHISQTDVTVVTVVGIITISLSSYGIIYAEKLFKLLHPVLRIFDFHKTANEQLLDSKPLVNHVVLIGANRLGSHILDSIKSKKAETLIIDFNPDVIHRYEKENYKAICGDISDPYVHEIANLNKAKLIISTIPDFNDNLAIFEFIKRNRRKIQIILTAEDEDEAKLLYKEGADYVLLPHFVGGLHLADIIEANHNLSSLAKLRKRHLKTLDSSLHSH